MAITRIVENGVQAKHAIEALEAQGYSREHIYIFAHYEKRSEDITKELHTEEVGLKEQGVVQAIKNIFTSRGDELRSQMQSVGLSESEAADAEEELDHGRLVIIASKDA
ncbi:general stress protein [Lysinibacillus alkalisoli]|uniref:General stress protein n=1 Tax=Lysinibacillus alkalisoli TaxID=1911548 RepID=A0A917LJJ8_9BACI|nr:general stress protein [Lysinibacillus alkalisoli]GGG31044.1 general stress protein [Lysinibacillus alkalisoli]